MRLMPDNKTYYDGHSYWVLADGSGEACQYTPIPKFIGSSSSSIPDCFIQRCRFSNTPCNIGSNSSNEDLDAVALNVPAFNPSSPNSFCGNHEYEEWLSPYTEKNDCVCPTDPFIATFQYKSIPIGDGTFVCISLDCSVIDCAQYQDCSPS